MCNQMFNATCSLSRSSIWMCKQGYESGIKQNITKTSKELAKLIRKIAYCTHFFLINETFFSNHLSVGSHSLIQRTQL